MNYQQLYGMTIKDGFKKFNEENPQIFEAFELEALELISKGKKQLSAKLIINSLRFNETITSNDKNFKINDAYQSYYSRLFVEIYPQFTHLFRFRKQRNEEKGIYMEVDNGVVSFL